MTLKKLQKKINIVLPITIFISLNTFAQEGRVGINTTAPKTSLDVSGKSDLSGVSLSSDVTGLQAPRITRAELTAKGTIYGSDQKGALVYITDIAAGDSVGPRINVNAIGYYYFDGSIWVSLGNTSSGAATTANNGVTMAANNLQLGGTLVKNTDIATAGFNTSFSGTGKVGIGTNNPNSTLAVEGSVEAGYREINSSYTLTNLDHYISYVGNSAITVTLPVVGSGTTSFSGRIYRIKNISDFDVTLSASATDKIRNQNSAGTSTFVIPAGHYVEIINNSNATGTGTWDLSYVGYPEKVASNYQLANIFDYTATAPQSVTYSSGTAGATTPLTGFLQAITIPANKEAKIIISYSIPVGTPSGTSPRGYYGVTMIKNNVEKQEGSRKFTQIPLASVASSVVTISATIADNIPATSAGQTITYSLRAYLEASNSPVLFGMNSATGINYNWGYGYWSLTVFYK